MRWWPWARRQPSPETLKAQEQLEAACRDDRKVADLTRRTARILKENNLAPAIIKALDIRK